MPDVRPWWSPCAVVAVRVAVTGRPPGLGLQPPDVTLVLARRDVSGRALSGCGGASEVGADEGLEPNICLQETGHPRSTLAPQLTPCAPGSRCQQP